MSVTLRQTRNGRYILEDTVADEELYFTSGDAALAEKLRREREYDNLALGIALEVLGEESDD